ncbi:cytochrome b/b6 domain-containing protein [Pseudolabrys sp. FHR47]|uniref:cytochrome b/b6 domain-containing protein n=1 Tax=Pseudolabrys sp. FHR47 TaxID=2562284 RepID=UPI001980AB8B|nr:cytochrome b/b6 domain-containing protein [Pseudolabrys sp. FHR47]
MHDMPHDHVATSLVEGEAVPSPSPVATRKPPPRTRVWDWVVRGFHWLLVAAIALAAATGYLAGVSWIDIHVWAGTAAATLIAGRVVWGFFGTTHARFSDFIVSPRTTLAHMRALLAGRNERHRGHNPLGAAMIVALLAVVAAIAITGVLAFGGVLKAGPLAFATTFAAGWQARQIHEALALILLGLVGLHIAGALFESWRTCENLVRAMVDGRKEVRHGDHVSVRRRAQPFLAASIAAILFATTAVTIWTLSLRPGLGVPVAKVDPVYTKECGACHTAYHPSLLPRASWGALIAGLDNHFGEDASLDTATAARLGDYLATNAAETADTLPANRLRQVEAAKPFTITATPFWTRRHAGIPDAVFASKAVSGRGNCVACHADASSGRFYPGNIDIPDEATP